MTTSLVAPTESQPPIVSSQPLDFKTWKEDGSRRFHNLQTTKNTLETNRWELGDWLVKGDEKFGKKAYDEAEQITGWQRGTLYNIVWVVGKFPTPSLRSETGLKWSHFKELARIEDEKVREDLLGLFNDGFPHSVLDVRSRVDEVLRKLKEQNGHRKEEKAQNPVVFLQVSLKPDLRDLIKNLARAEQTAPDVLLGKIVADYFWRNRKPIANKIEKLKRSKNPQRSKSR